MNTATSPYFKRQKLKQNSKVSVQQQKFN